MCYKRNIIHIRTFKSDGQSIAIYTLKVGTFDKHNKREKDKTIEGDGWNQNFVFFSL